MKERMTRNPATVKPDDGLNRIREIGRKERKDRKEESPRWLTRQFTSMRQRSSG